MSYMNEMNLRWLAASVGLPEDEKGWNEEQLERWILVVHDYEDKLSVEKLTKQLGRFRKEARERLHRIVRLDGVRIIRQKAVIVDACEYLK